MERGGLVDADDSGDERDARGGGRPVAILPDGEQPVNFGWSINGDRGGARQSDGSPVFARVGVWQRPFEGSGAGQRAVGPGRAERECGNRTGMTGSRRDGANLFPREDCEPVGGEMDSQLVEERLGRLDRDWFHLPAQEKVGSKGEQRGIGDRRRGDHTAEAGGLTGVTRERDGERSLTARR